MTTFGKPQDVEPLTVEQSSFCSVLGCTNQWSVRTEGDRSKCSFHQWLVTKSQVKSSYVIPLQTKSNISDGNEFWPKKILARFEFGEQISSYSLRLAKAVLGLTT